MPAPRASCPICMDTLNDAVCLTCGHVFCGPCLNAYAEQLIQSHKPAACPTCRKRYCQKPTKLFIDFQEDDTPSGGSAINPSSSTTIPRPSQPPPRPISPPTLLEPPPFALARPLDAFTAHYLKTYREEITQLKSRLSETQAQIARIAKEKGMAIQQNRTVVAQRDKAVRANDQLLIERQQYVGAARALEEEVIRLRSRGERLAQEIQQRDEFIEEVRRNNPYSQSLSTPCCSQNQTVKQLATSINALMPY